MFRLCFVCIFTVFVCGYCCPNGWLKYRSSKCIKYFAFNVTYASAERLCQSLNASLISIHSSDEEGVVFSYGGENIQKHNQWVWLGAKRVNESLKWFDGSVFDYSNIPDGCRDDSKASTCLAMHLMPKLEKTLTFWCLFDCETNINHVLCQRSSDNFLSESGLIKSSIAFKETNNASIPKTLSDENKNKSVAWYSSIIEQLTNIYSFVLIALILLSAVLHLILVLKLCLKGKRQEKKRATNEVRALQQKYCFDDIYDEAKTI